MAEDTQNKKGEEQTNTTEAKESDIDLEELDLAPIRTLQGDLSRLLEKNKLTKDDFKKLDKDLRRETEEYHKKGGDRHAAEELRLFAEDLEKKDALKKEPDEISKLFASPKDTFVDKASKKARINTDEIRKNLIYDSSAGRGPLPPGEVQKRKEEPTAPQKEKEEKSSVQQAPIAPVRAPIEKEEKKPEPKDETVGGATIRKLPQIKKAPPPPPPPKPNPLVELEKERARIERELQNLPSKERVIDEQISRLTEQKDRLTNFLSPLIQKEAELEERITQTETEEAKTPDLETRKQLEQTRWTLEDKRREIEEKRWQADQEIIKLQRELEEAQARKNTFTDKKTSLELELADIDKKKRGILAEKELAILHEKLKEVEDMKEPLELEWISLNERKERDSQDLARLTSEEEGIEAKLRDVELQEREATDPNERHNFEVERWKTEQARRDVEKNKWSLEEELENIQAGMKELGIKYKKILEAEKLIEDKIRELETLQDEVSSGFRL